MVFYVEKIFKLLLFSDWVHAYFSVSILHTQYAVLKWIKLNAFIYNENENRENFNKIYVWQQICVQNDKLFL